MTEGCESDDQALKHSPAAAEHNSYAVATRYENGRRILFVICLDEGKEEEEEEVVFIRDSITMEEEEEEAVFGGGGGGGGGLYS